MQVGERHVLTVEKLPLVLKVLNTLATRDESEDGGALGIFKRLEELAKEGCGRLILNLRVIAEPLSETPEEIRNVRASLIGGVLVVSCQATTREILRLKDLARRRFFPKQLTSGFGAFVAGLETAAQRIASPTR